jgi:hypothetical protein
MTKAQFEGIVRAIAAAGGGYLIGRGIDAELVTPIVGALATAAVAIWSYASKRAA